MRTGARLFLLLAIAQAPSAGMSQEMVTAEQALAHYRVVTSVTTMRCAAIDDDAEIVVCGTLRRPSPRLPLPDEAHEIGERVRLVPGEMPRADLGRPCPSRGCQIGGGSLFDIVGKIFSALTE